MPTFRDVFEAYGADYDTTMARFMGNEAMYLQLLDMLFQDENGAVDKAHLAPEI